MIVFGTVGFKVRGLLVRYTLRRGRWRFFFTAQSSRLQSTKPPVTWFEPETGFGPVTARFETATVPYPARPHHTPHAVLVKARLARMNL